MVDRDTIEVYEARAAEWEARRRVDATAARTFAGALDPADVPVLDLGCGPGWHLSSFPAPRIGLDAAAAFTTRARHHDPGALVVQADLARLPFRRGTIGAVWASRSLVHLPRSTVPLALWDLHRAMRVGAPVRLHLFGGDAEFASADHDDFPGRRFSLWPTDLLAAVVEGSGFVDVHVEVGEGDQPPVVVTAVRGRTLADTVGPDMRLLLVGLNPSLYSADVGSGFARPGNRFWPAALAAGIVSRPRDPLDALASHGVGMTDLVKRASRAAAELDPSEYAHGLARLDALVSWLEPAAVCIVGLAGWRAAVERKATTGWHERGVGGRPVYVMPNPSGLNAHDTIDTLAAHLRAAAAGPPST